jgi:hypothetical protein
MDRGDAMNRKLVFRGQGPAPLGYVKCRLGEECSSSEGGPHYHPQTDVNRRWVPPHAPDPRPGFYYVSAIDGKKRFLIRGPFTTHLEAMKAVESTRMKAEELDPHAFWWAWGTARTEQHSGLGTLDHYESEEANRVERKRGRIVTNRAARWRSR